MPTKPLLVLGLATALGLGAVAPSTAMTGPVSPVVATSGGGDVTAVGWRRGVYGHRHWRRGWRGRGWRYGYRPYRPWRGYAYRRYRYY